MRHRMLPMRDERGRFIPTRYADSIYGPHMTREEDQLYRESDERAAFNDRLDAQRMER